MNTINNFVEEIAKLKPCSTFMSIHGYRNEHSEVADYSIVFNMSYTNALKRSIETLNTMSLSNDLERQARDELISSYTKSLANPIKVEEREPHYEYFVNEEGEPIKGIKVHSLTNTLHLYGLQVHKRVLMPGSYPVVNSRPLTIAKKKLSSLTSVGRFRQFRLTTSNVDKVCVEKLELLPPS